MSILLRVQKSLKQGEYSYSEQDEPDTENIRGLNLAAVMCTTVQVSRLPL
jgi:hypothetical protein